MPCGAATGDDLCGMDVRTSYDRWSGHYDAMENRTRDLEAKALRSLLGTMHVERCLEVGCGTGKNTAWLLEHAAQVTAVDLSEGMLAKAREKVRSGRVDFQQADILRPWPFGESAYDLVTFSLVLEHVERLGPVLAEAARALRPDGRLYIGELHPFKQYAGTKARFAAEGGEQVVPCFDHHLTDFVHAAEGAGLVLARIEEHFDAEDRTGPPRILTLLFRKP